MSKKALVVEDDGNIAELLRLYLERDGFEVQHAADGGEGVAMFRTFNPDIVLLDIMLPVMDGWGVLREIRKDKSTPVIMGMGVPATATKAGCSSFAVRAQSPISFSSSPRIASVSVRAEMKTRESVSYQRGSSWVL